MTTDTEAAQPDLGGEEGCMACYRLREQMRQARETLDHDKVSKAAREARRHLAEVHLKAIVGA
ncbi:hypothetical protein EKH77_12335 [Streptomyces luteoverticillatus]|uniref:Uncharacterized protein n=1 Tax=Streptomyces luteoverticillatus TaxID=66425 RepID=A0A3S9PHR4_STRLT|nr:hypothetical protein [Streptomyces luteoverticillatus]AZQ71891.1 hypothetical protein EKH77_12335 [Streptomyces luteoverticillatus]